MSGQLPYQNESQVQEDLLRLDAYRGQLNAMVQQLQYLASSRNDHVRARDSLEGLERSTGPGKMLVPIGGDALLRASPNRSAKVFLGVGSGVVVELDRPKVSEMLAQRLDKIDQAAKELEGQIRTLEERIQLLAQRLDSVTRASREAEGGPLDDVGGD